MKKVAISRVTGDVFKVVQADDNMVALQKHDERPLYVDIDDTDFIMLLNVSDALVDMVTASVHEHLGFGCSGDCDRE